MRFWIVDGPGGETLGCELTKRAAQEAGRSMGFDNQHLTVRWVDVEVCSDNIRRLLGGLGGYARQIDHS